MPTSAFTKFENFSEDLAEKIHDLNADALLVYLTNGTPDVANDTVKSELAEIDMSDEANHGAGGADTQNSTSRSGGTTSVVGVDPDPFLASGGPVGPFRYAVLYNDTQTSPADPLIGFWDYGSALTLEDGESLELDFGAALFTIA